MKLAHRVAVLCVWMLVGVSAPLFAQSGITRVNVAADGAQAHGQSDSAAISQDGRYVVFSSEASNLVAGDTNGVEDVFLRDRQTGTIERVSLGAGSTQALGASFFPSISADGRFVAFGSIAANLVIGDSNGAGDIFVRDRQTATTTRVNVATSGAEAFGVTEVDAAISANGRYVAFGTTAALVADDTNGQSDVYLRDRMAGSTVRVSVTSMNEQTTERSAFPSMSADGRFITFTAFNPTLLPGDTTGAEVFVRDVQAGITTRVSVGPGGVHGNGLSFGPSISGDGRFIVFMTLATNFDAGGRRGLFVHDRQRGVTVGLRLEPGNTPITLLPFADAISGDGRVICYGQRTDFVGRNHLFAIDRQTSESIAAAVTPAGLFPDGDSSRCALNADGTMIAFASLATNLVIGDTNGQRDVFVRTAAAIASLDRITLGFGAVVQNGTFVSQTPAQVVRLTHTGDAPVTWTASANQSWLQVTPASGSGPATLSVSVTPAAGLPASGTVSGTITVSLTGAANQLMPIAVGLSLTPNATSLAPFGYADTPTDNRTGVTGAVPFTGWALDNVEVTRVSICRAPVGAEVAPLDPNCGGAAEIFVGFAVFIEGARPDVAVQFAAYPLATRAGWGFMLLTNMLPNQGNGTYAFTVRAQDREGQWSVLGRRTMTCANASAIRPFGTIDTPLQGGTASGNNYVNFGWVLTPQPKTIPIDGSTIHVLIDGVSVGTADYNHARPDIQAAFPGYSNTDGAVGFRVLDTTALTNGLHTISWTVTDDQGVVEGIGSRFFTVSNGVAVSAASTSARMDTDVEAVPLETAPLAGRRGWNLGAPFELLSAAAADVTVIQSEEVSRVELQLGDGEYTGYLRTPAGLARLPIGSRLDPATNTFTWAPGVGFVGRYDFVFARAVDGRIVSRREVRIILQPKGRAVVDPALP